MGRGRRAGVGRAKGLDWVRYEPRRTLVSLAAVSAAAELAHRRLADVVWAEGEWPVNEPETLARLVRQDPSALPSLWKELQGLGWKSCGTFLHHDGVALVRREAAQILIARRASGRIGADARWSTDRKGSGDAEAMPLPSAADAKALPEPMPKAWRVQYSKSTVQAINNAERLTLSGSARMQSAVEAEKAFLSDVRQMLEQWRKGSGTAELQNWGGWWRTAFRKNARKARAVLNDVRSLAREGRITSSPGAAAMDLWKRLP
jgi:hypothetical protein